MNASRIAKRDRLVVYLQERPWLVPGPVLMYWPQETRVHSIASISKSLLADSEFRALQLGSWLETPDGEIIGEAVGMVISPAYRPAYELLVEGLTLAASNQARESRRTAGTVAACVVGAAGIVLFWNN